MPRKGPGPKCRVGATIVGAGETVKKRPM
jgi:hypothetical protein